MKEKKPFDWTISLLNTGIETVKVYYKDDPKLRDEVQNDYMEAKKFLEVAQGMDLDKARVFIIPDCITGLQIQALIEAIPWRKK